MEILEPATLSSDENQGVRAVVDWLEKSTRELSGVMEMIYVMIGMWVTQEYSFFKTQQLVYLGFMLVHWVFNLNEK